MRKEIKVKCIRYNYVAGYVNVGDILWVDNTYFSSSSNKYFILQDKTPSRNVWVYKDDVKPIDIICLGGE